MTWLRPSTPLLTLALLVCGFCSSCADYEPTIEGQGDQPEEEEEEETETMRKGIPPWHLWGDSKIIEVPYSVALLNFYSSQVAKVSYGRPETWTFYFASRILNLTPDDTAGEIDIYFDVTIGVGRSQVTMEGFERHMFSWTNAPSPIGGLKYSTEVYGPNRTDIPIPPAYTIPSNIISEITAQDIQVQARAVYTGGTIVPKSATVEVTAYFAPRSHIRPEWFKGEFPGGEDNGT